MKLPFMMSVLGLSALFFLSSCNKDQDLFLNSSVTSSQDITTQQFLLEANETEINDQIENAFSELFTRGFPTRSWAQAKGTYPNTLTIDYGPNGVAGPYGHIRKGKIIIEFTDAIINPGAVRTVRHENFFIDNVQIAGTVSLSNQGLNASDQPEFSRVVADRILSFPSGKSSRWNASQVLTQREGSKTLIRIDDVWSISGSASGISREGKNIALNTIESLIFPVACHYFVDGIINLNANNELFSIDYGDGSCDNDAMLTLPDGSQQAINIKRWW